MLEHLDRMEAHLRELLEKEGGWLPFERFMHEALYAPGLGYYTAGSRKLATPTDSAGSSDFITAPELSPWFGATLSTPVADVLRDTNSLDVLEVGAGTGALAASLLPALAELGLPVNYYILEVSADLRERQQQTLAAWEPQVRWLDRLPERFRGCVLGNELLDAMPVRLFCWSQELEVLERGVVWHDHGWTWHDVPADSALSRIVRERMPPLPGYLSEVNLQAEGWMHGLGDWLEAGAALLIDYGFPQHEYYHPQRHRGTLMCHFRHQASDDPLKLVGLQDITAHIDFTAMADAAHASGLEVLGYTSQAAFLLDAGLLEHLQSLRESDAHAYVLQLNSVQKLIQESEMGELFKVLAVGREAAVPRGFRRDRLHSL